MGAAVNQIGVSKVMLCFTLASHKSHRARHLSGCRCETQHPTPVTQTPWSLGRWRGLTCQLPVEKWGHSILLGVLFYMVKRNRRKENIVFRVYRELRIHATGFRVKRDIFVCFIWGFNKTDREQIPDPYWCPSVLPRLTALSKHLWCCQL